MPALVELLDVSKSFGSVKAIEDVSLTVDEGEALGIVGPNGAGKTTLLNVIAGSLRADRGPRRLRGPRRHERSPATSTAAPASPGPFRSRAPSRD